MPLYILISRAVINISADYARTCSGSRPFFLLSAQINTRINSTVRRAFASGVWIYTHAYGDSAGLHRRLHLFSDAESLLRTSWPLSYAWNALRWTCKLPPHIPPRRPLPRQTMQIRKQAGKKLRLRLLLLAVHSAALCFMWTVPQACHPRPSLSLCTSDLVDRWTQRCNWLLEQKTRRFLLVPAQSNNFVIPSTKYDVFVLSTNKGYDLYWLAIFCVTFPCVI